jgi:hypothetical protein
MLADSTRALWLLGTLSAFACSSSPTLPGSTNEGTNSAGGQINSGAAGDSMSNGTAGTDGSGVGGAATGGGGSSGGSTTTTDGGSGSQATMADSGTMAQSCNPVTEKHPSEGNLHQAICSPLVYHTNPPSSGDHYPVWAVYKSYAKPFLRGFFVHNLEHGAVVITYNCPGGCAAEVSAAQAMIDSLPADPDCGAHRRIVMLPDPDLDVRFAASAWGVTLKASCFDAPAFAKFYVDNIGHGLELVCDDGYDPLTDGQNGGPICP